MGGVFFDFPVLKPDLVFEHHHVAERGHDHTELLR